MLLKFSSTQLWVPCKRRKEQPVLLRKLVSLQLTAWGAFHTPTSRAALFPSLLSKRRACAMLLNSCECGVEDFCRCGREMGCCEPAPPQCWCAKQLPPRICSNVRQARIRCRADLVEASSILVFRNQAAQRAEGVESSGPSCANIGLRDHHPLDCSLCHAY
jgi:hypothetical protein